MMSYLVIITSIIISTVCCRNVGNGSEDYHITTKSIIVPEDIITTKDIIIDSTEVTTEVPNITMNVPNITMNVPNITMNVPNITISMRDFTPEGYNATIIDTTPPVVTPKVNNFNLTATILNMSDTIIAMIGREVEMKSKIYEIESRMYDLNILISNHDIRNGKNLDKINHSLTNRLDILYDLIKMLENNETDSNSTLNSNPWDPNNNVAKIMYGVTGVLSVGIIILLCAIRMIRNKYRIRH